MRAIIAATLLFGAAPALTQVNDLQTRLDENSKLSPASTG